MKNKALVLLTNDGWPG